MNSGVALGTGVRYTRMADEATDRERKPRPEPALSGTDRIILAALTGRPDGVAPPDFGPPGPVEVDDGPAVGSTTGVDTRAVTKPWGSGQPRESGHPAAQAPTLGDAPTVPLPLRPASNRSPAESAGAMRTVQGRAPSSRSSASLPVSSFDTGSHVSLDDPRTNPLVWLGFGMCAALLGQGAAWWFFHAGDTFGGAMMFSLALLAGVIHPLFQRNAQEIWSRRLTPGQANRLLAGDLLVLFLGLILGYMAVPLAMGAESYATAFSGISRFVDARRIQLLSFDHGNVGGILFNNIRVFLVFFLIGLLFRYVGTLIVVVYNASTWGVVFAAALSGTIAAGSGPVEIAVFMMAVAPHLVVETLAYLLAAMAGIFLSRGALRYAWTSERFLSVGAAVLSLAGFGILLVALAAVLEATWAHHLIHWAFRDAHALGG
jgi:hypothetical protein